MLKIGLTGGIGSGKTTVAQVFALLGVPVYYADDASKRLYHTDPELKAALEAAFGNDLYDAGILNRTRLSERVFGDPAKMELLNSIVHPPTIRDAVQWMSVQKSPYIIKEAALLFESGSVRDLDYVIGVSAPNALRLKRSMSRDGANRDAILARMARQIDEKIKMQLCDFIINNNEQEPVIPQVLALHEQLMELSAGRSFQ
jgi:dephospho-CoA kinase